MSRFLRAGVLAGAFVFQASLLAQDSLSTLAQKADAATAEWEGLAKTFDARTARLLPCDARMKSAIDELSRTSEARLAATADYLRAAIVKAKEDGASAAKLGAGLKDFPAEINAEATDADQLRAGLEAQSGDLSDSAKRRPAVEEPRRALNAVTQLVRQDLPQALSRGLENLNTNQNDLSVTYQARVTALENELNALTAESARWTAYYAARLARTQVECQITNNTLAPDTPSKQKQKQRKKKQ